MGERRWGEEGHGGGVGAGVVAGEVEEALSGEGFWV